jgi:hypothetical protein
MCVSVWSSNSVVSFPSPFSPITKTKSYRETKTKKTEKSHPLGKKKKKRKFCIDVMPLFFSGT